jgi:hypothetical protein
VAQSLLLVKAGRGQEALPLITHVSEYAKQHNLQNLGLILKLGKFFIQAETWSTRKQYSKRLRL